jgi:spermidine synthase
VGVSLPPLLLLFAGSGAAALIYETVWLQLLQLVIGSSAVSVGVLLGTFMGGMCLGSLGLPKAISSRRHPLRVYALLELGVGICALLLLASMPLIGRVYFAAGGSGISGFLVRGLVSAVCLLPPTILMGATLPAVSRWIETTPEGVSWLGWFYAGNIAGAVCGCLAAGFYLLRFYDMATATFVAVLLNIIVAALAWKLALSVRLKPDATSGVGPKPDATSDASPSVASGFSLTPAWTVYLAIALSGFSALAGEVIWTRLIGLLFGATVYTFSIILAAFLIGLGAGSAGGSVLARRVAHPRVALACCQLLAAAAISWTAHKLTVSFPYWPITPTLSPNVGVDFEMDLVRTLWAVLPPAFFWGASFPLALASVAETERDSARLVGAVYAANTTGAVVGALGASLLLVAWLGSQRAQQIMMVASLLAAVAAIGSVSPVRRAGIAGMIVLIVLVLFDGWLLRGIRPVPGLVIEYGRFTATVQGQAGDIIFSGEGLNSSVAVSRLPNGRLGYHNAGKIQASSEPQDMRLQRMLGHLTTLVPPHARSVLVIGCGAGVTAGAVSIDPLVERVTIAEIEPLVPRVVSTYFGAENHHVIDNPKVRVEIDDARHFLLTSKDKFDAITSDPLDPWVKGAATLYTKEFFEAARAHLNPGGVVTLFVQLYESTPEAVKSEMGTFFAVFPEGIIAGNTFRGVGYDTVLLGQVGPAHIDVDALDARLTDPAYAAVSQSLRDVGVRSAVDLLASYAGRAVDLQPWLRGAAINRDGDLRLQYLAGLGLNANEGDRVYAEILKYRRYPDDLFVGSERLLGPLRRRISQP